MAAGVPAKPTPENPCCKAWKEKCAEIKRKRDCLRQAVGILQPELEKAQTEISRLKKEYQEEKAHADVGKERKEKESAAGVALENEVSRLKSEIFSMQQRFEQDIRDKNKELKLLHDQISKGEMEISRLKELLEKEKLKADNAEEERKKAVKKLKSTKSEKVNNEKAKSLHARISEANKEITQLKELVGTAKLRADSENRKAESEKKKAKDYLAQLEELRNKANESSSELASMSSKFEKVSRQLEAEEQKTMKERKRADSESAKAKEQRKLAEQNMKRAEEEQSRTESLSQQLEVARQGIEELQKEMEKNIAFSKKKYAENSVRLEEQRRLVEANKKIAIKEKSRGDNLAQQIQEAKLVIENLLKQVDGLSSSQKLVENLPISPLKLRDAGTDEVKILRKQLKFERMRVKHAKQAAKLEKLRKDVMQEELGRLKLEFIHFSNRLNLLDGYFSTDMETTDDLGKVKGSSNMQRLCRPPEVNLRSENRHSNLRGKTVAGTDPHKLAQQVSSLLIPISGRECGESVTGINSELKSLIGGSDKKMLESSGINSSAASFSDGRFVASQGKGEFSVTTSTEIAEENFDAQPKNSNVSAKVTDARSNANLVLMAGNSLQRPCSNVLEVVDEHQRKRERLLEAVESIIYLCSEDKKLHLEIEEKLGFLHRLLVRKRDKPLKEGKASLPHLQGGSYANQDSIGKKRKASHETNKIMQHFGEPQKFKKMKKSEAKTCENPMIVRETSQSAGNLIGAARVSREKRCDYTASGCEAELRLAEVANADYMKLLELDKSEDEKYYKMAVEMPLSPSLPEIDFEDGGNVSKDEGPTKSLDMRENDEDNLSVTVQSGGAQNSARTVGMSNIPSSRDKSGSKHDHIPQQCVVFSNIKDPSSIIKIFRATKNCIDRCPKVTKAEWLVPEILLGLKTDENLLVPEKVCVLLSLLLLNFSVAAAGKIGSFLNCEALFCLDSFSRHIAVAIASAEAQSLFTELLDDLLSLLQDFLLEQRVLYTNISSETFPECNSRINVPLDGVNVVLSDRVASIDQLVAGSAILASICIATARIGFIPEASFEILYKHSYNNTSRRLTILHVFAYLAADKIFSSEESNLEMTVLKSIIVFLENRHSASTTEGGAEFHPCVKCPFSDGSASLEVVVSVLLEILQKFAQSGPLHQNTISLSDSSSLFCLDKTEISLRHEDVQCVCDTNCDAFFCMRNNELRDAQPKAIDRRTLCQLCDVLSLVELVAGYMTWDWTSTNIVAPLLKMLELPLSVDFSVAIVSLLGQLGSLGVTAGNYEDVGVEDLRVKLSDFMQQETTLRAGIPVQIATASALLLVLPSDFEEIVQGRVTHPATSSLSVSANLVKKWFSLLSEEQQGFAIRVLRSAHQVTD